MIFFGRGNYKLAEAVSGVIPAISDPDQFRGNYLHDYGGGGIINTKIQG